MTSPGKLPWRILLDFLLVERLPESARDIECQEFADQCDPDNSSTNCFVCIEPSDFDLLARRVRLRKNEDTSRKISVTRTRWG